MFFTEEETQRIEQHTEGPIPSQRYLWNQNKVHPCALSTEILMFPRSSTFLDSGVIYKALTKGKLFSEELLSLLQVNIIK